jgi:hypothetical protein
MPFNLRVVMLAASFAEASAFGRAAGREPPVFPEQTLLGRYSFPAAGPMSPEDSARDAIDDGFGNRPRDLGRERSEIFASFRTEQDRTVPVIVNPVSRINLPVFPALGWYPVPLGLRKVVPYRRPIQWVLL